MYNGTYKFQATFSFQRCTHAQDEFFDLTASVFFLVLLQVSVLLVRSCCTRVRSRINKNDKYEDDIEEELDYDSINPICTKIIYRSD